MSLSNQEEAWSLDCRANFEESLKLSDFASARECIEDARERGMDVRDWEAELSAAKIKEI